MKDPTNSDVLWGKIHLAEGRLFAATDVFWNHPDLALLFPEFLVQAHCMMRCGFTLMSVAGERALNRPEDTVALTLAAYLKVHLEEELGHDKWLLDDIMTLGISEQDVLLVRPCEALIGLVGAQYFWMMHVHPVAIMGYLTLMEGYAPLVDQLEEIRVRTGAPPTAFRCLKAHAEDDPAHLADINRTLDDMDLSPGQAKAVGLCAFAAIEGLAAMFEELVEKHLERSAVRSPGELQHAHA
jgi:Iron-containing redox enzyme